MAYKLRKNDFDGKWYVLIPSKGKTKSFATKADALEYIVIAQAKANGELQ